MARFSFTRTNFLGGEVSRRGDSRSDLAQYGLGCKQLHNFIVMPSGGARKRPGTRYTKGTKDNNPARIMDFIVSNDDPDDMFVTEFSKDASDHEIKLAMTRLSDLTSYDVTLDNSSYSGGTYTNQNVALNELQYAQSADTQFIVHKGMEPMVLRRTATTPTFSAYRYSQFTTTGFLTNEFRRFPMRDENIGPMTITPSATTGIWSGAGTGVSLTASANFFDPGHVGAYFRLTHSSTNGWFKVLEYISATVVRGTVLEALGATTATSNWQESAWSDYRGWPRSVTFYNSRLVFGGNDAQPDTFWASATFNFFEMTSTDPTTKAVTSGLDDALVFTLTSSKMNQIQWMVGGKKLSIGTTSGEQVGEFREDGTNLFVDFAEETSNGSAYIQPFKFTNTVPFVQRSGRRMMEMVFDFDSDSYVANDLNLLRDDLSEGFWNKSYTENKIVGVAYQNSPFPINWCFDEKGALYGITRDRTQQINAWHSHALGGVISENAISGLAGDDHAAMVTSICTTPSPDNTSDRLWLIVRREVNGSEVYYLEYFDKFRDMDQLQFVGNTGEVYFYFLDSAKYAYSGTLTSSFTGFSHLAGEEVSLMLDGKYAGTATVTGGGGITVPNGLEGNALVAGFLYKSRLKTNRTEGGSQIGSSTGAKRRADEIRINVYKSRFFKFGTEGDFSLREELEGTVESTQTDASDSRLEDHVYVDPQEIPNEPYYTESGIVRKPAPAGYDDKAVAVILSDLPYPCTILGITIRAVEADV